jgi:oxygen-independent coproporphyrinogen-3 oxidase
MDVPFSIYLHIPFCIHRCSYCDFNTYAGLDTLIPAYLDALEAEIACAAGRVRERVQVSTVFFGGGTPSLLPVRGVERILKALSTAFQMIPDNEITLEANPGTLSLRYLQDLRGFGVNRLSLGMQSSLPEELCLLERTHDRADVIRSVEWARRAGFNQLNLDLIFGVPHQTLAMWEQSLSMALALNPEHLSLYALTLEHGTPMRSFVQRGLLPEPDSDLAADMYELAIERLEGAGFQQYEISNWAKTDVTGQLFACRHNLQYWRNLPYLGFGAGAHGYAAGVRTANVLAPQAYIQRCLQRCQDITVQPFPITQATVETRSIDLETEIGETMMMGLRLTQEGVSSKIFKQRFKLSMEERFRDQIDRMISLGLMERAGVERDILRLTHRGRLLGNQVFVEFI